MADRNADLRTTWDTPLQVSFLADEVVILGPAGLRGSLTPAAAEISALRLLAAARGAVGDAVGPGPQDASADKEDLSGRP